MPELDHSHLGHQSITGAENEVPSFLYFCRPPSIPGLFTHPDLSVKDRYLELRASLSTAHLPYQFITRFSPAQERGMTPSLDLIEGKRDGKETLISIQMLDSKLEAFARNPVHRHCYTDRDVSDTDPESDSDPEEGCLLDHEEQDLRHRLSAPSSPPRRTTPYLSGPSFTTEHAAITDSTTVTHFAWIDTLDPGLKTRVQDTLLKAIDRLLIRHRKGESKKENPVGAAAVEVLWSERKEGPTTEVIASPPEAPPRQARSSPLPTLDISQAHGRANRGHRGQSQPMGLEDELRQEEEEQYYRT